MATIRKLPSGKWNVQIRRKGHPVASKTFSSKSNAEKWSRISETDIERNIFVDRSEAESTTLANALNRYLIEVTPHKKGAVQESRKIKVWLRHSLSKRSLASLKPSDFALYRDTRLSEVSPATVRLELAVISHLFNIARKEWNIEGLPNPLNDIRKPKPSNARNRRLSENEINKLLEACKQSKTRSLYELVMVALETAMRLGELLSMTWSQVDAQNRLIRLYDTKNGEDRVVPLSARAISVFDSIPITSLTSRVFFSWRCSSNIKKSWNTALRMANIDDFHFHDLRHEATSRFFEMGLNPIEVATITGHKSMQMLKRYTHPRLADLTRKLDGSSPY